MALIIKYSNRKLYNTKTHKYVTLSELSALKSFKVIEYSTKSDVTDLTKAAMAYFLTKANKTPNAVGAV
jgi:polyhydroxyalkanoate synthesis regulator protein